MCGGKCNAVVFMSDGLNHKTKQATRTDSEIWRNIKKNLAGNDINLLSVDGLAVVKAAVF